MLLLFIEGVYCLLRTVLCRCLSGHWPKSLIKKKKSVVFVFFGSCVVLACVFYLEDDYCDDILFVGLRLFKGGRSIQADWECLRFVICAWLLW